jgi:phage baseplate assembly protein W
MQGQIATVPERDASAAAGLGQNWRLEFSTADGIPLNMFSFEQIDFGAVSFKEIFQNVKTILLTPLLSAALERTLGVDNSIVDRPMPEASQMTVTILEAVTYWEPRCKIMDIGFSSDGISGHLAVKLQLNIVNVFYGTSTPYTVNNIFGAPPPLPAVLPPPVPPATVVGPAGPMGPAGAAGARGSLWFTGSSAPPVGPLMPMAAPPKSPSMQGPAGAQGAKGQRGFVWLQGAGAPVAPQDLDMYLDTSTGDVWQYDGAAGTWRRTAKP